MRTTVTIDDALYEKALTHPMVILEIACGTPPSPRTQTLNDLSLLRPCQQASLFAVAYQAMRH